MAGEHQQSVAAHQRQLQLLGELHEDTSFACQNCPTVPTFKTQARLLQHILMKHAEIVTPPGYEETIQQATKIIHSCSFKKTVEKPLKAKAKPQLWQCEQCNGQTFAKLSSLQQHTHDKHETPVGITCTISNCKKVFQSETALAQHMGSNCHKRKKQKKAKAALPLQTKGTDGNVASVCEEYSEQSFVNMKDLLTHDKHEAPAVIMCTISSCKRVFQSETALAQHIGSHCHISKTEKLKTGVPLQATGSDGNVCEQCSGRSFKNMKGLLMHLLAKHYNGSTNLAAVVA